MIRGVFFDLDGTLYDRDEAIRRIGEEQYDAFREEFHIEKPVFLAKLLELDCHGHGRAPKLHHALGALLGFDAATADRLEDYFRSRYPGTLKMTNDTAQTLHILRASGKKLGIVTNGPSEWQRRKIDSLNLTAMVDTIVVSGEEGVDKPDPRIFALALDRSGLEAGECLFVGDHPAADVQGALNAGLLPVWKRMPYWEPPQGVPAIDRISEVLRMIG